MEVALASASLITLTLAIFFVWVFPGNQATAQGEFFTLFH